MVHTLHHGLTQSILCIRTSGNVEGRLEFAIFRMMHVVSTLASFHTLRSAGHAVLVVLLFYAGFLIVVTIHELGHYLTGIACGFDMYEFRVGFVRWRRASGWGLTRKWSHFLSGGVTGIPRKPDR